MRRTSSAAKAVARALRCGGLLLALGVAGTAWCEAARADSITINGGSQLARATNDTGSLDSETDVVSSGVSSWTQTTSASDTDRSPTSAASIDTALGASALSFDIDLEAGHYRGNSGWGSGSVTADIFFTPSDDVAYTLSGSLSRTSGAGTIQQRVFLLEDGTANYLFNQLHSTTGSSLALDASGLAGTLEGGTGYRLRIEYFLGTKDYNGAADGTGDVLLELGSATTPVPEPATLTLMGLGAAGLALARRRKGR